MKKSAAVPATLVSSVALSLVLAGCSGQSPVDVRRCVDAQNRLRPDQECERRGGYYGGGIGAAAGYGLSRFVYGGRTENGRVVGFRSAPRSGAAVHTPSGRVIRGGFGGSGRSFGGFGG